MCGKKFFRRSWCCQIVYFLALFFIVFSFLNEEAFAQRQMEQLDRGVVATYVDSNQVLVQWRKFANDPDNIGFNVYMKSTERQATQKNKQPIRVKTNFLVEGVDGMQEFYVVPVIHDKEGQPSKSFVLKNHQPYLSVPLNIPKGGVTPDGRQYDYRANDCSVGDLDGDGSYEIILKWDPSNAKDNSHSGCTGNVILDAYKLNGEQLWRINLGHNIRAGAHYTQFLVYDLDGDGKAEMVCKTADGTVDGEKNVLGDKTADYRNSTGRVLSGPEYLTIFNGETGKAMATTQYVPQRFPGNDNPTPDKMNQIWGDLYGNRIDRFLACVAYLDGKRPSVVMCRGYYTRTVLAAFDWQNGELKKRWVFDTMKHGNSDYGGQGNHNLTVADIDMDGKDEIVYGSMAVDDDGSGLYSTGLGHGDAMHVSDFDPSHPGLESFVVHEEYPNSAGIEFREVGTGNLIWGLPGDHDIGRGVAFDIDPNHQGAECWASNGRGVFSCKGDLITKTYPTSGNLRKSYNMAAWWDGDLLRELVDKANITKWNWENQSTDVIFSGQTEDVQSNNGTKSNPCLIADILGDWREEIIFRKSDNTELRIFITPFQTKYGFYTLMHDPQYRLSIVWQNVGYNQPAHTSFFLGAGMASPPLPEAQYISVENPFVDN